MVNITENFRKYRESEIRLDKNRKQILEEICSESIENIELYHVVCGFTRIPWIVTACIHYRESDQNFSRHLHNGDPLTDRTHNWPPGRPEKGQPPFSWVESAIDALYNRWKPEVWSVSTALGFMEYYNGLGYRKRGIESPYVWSWTDRYISGLYVSDGRFDAEKIDSRPGCAAIIKTMEAAGVDMGLVPS